MALEAELSDGTILEFPDGTHPDVVRLTVKRQLGLAGPPRAPAPPTFAETLAEPQDYAAPAPEPTVTPGRSVMAGITDRPGPTLARANPRPLIVPPEEQVPALSPIQQFVSEYTPKPRPSFTVPPIPLGEPNTLTAGLPVLETQARMLAGLAGTAGGALGAGAAAIPDVLAGRTDQAAEGIKQGMQDYGELKTPRIFQQTQALEKSTGDVFNLIREKWGEGNEALETLRGSVAQGIVPPWLSDYVKARPEAARTLAEYGFDAAMITAPVRFLGRSAKKTYTPDYGARRPGPEAPPPPPAGPGETIDGTAVRIDENAPRIPPQQGPVTAPEAPIPPPAPVAPAAPVRGTPADLAAVMGDKRPLHEIRAEQDAQAAAEAQQQIATQAAAAGIPAQGERAHVTWPDGEVWPVTILRQDANGARVETENGGIFDITTEQATFAPAPPGENTPESHVEVTHPDHIRAAEQRIDTEATPDQIKGDNARLAHVEIQGIPITLETAKGAERRDLEHEPPQWVVPAMPAAYGRIKGTKGPDSKPGERKKEGVDVYVGDDVNAKFAYVVDQIDPATGKFDEPKTFVQFSSKPHAVATYHAAFNDGSGPSRIGAITQMTVPEFKEWLKGDTTKAVAYKGPTEEEQRAIEDRNSRTEWDTAETGKPFTAIAYRARQGTGDLPKEQRGFWAETEDGTAGYVYGTSSISSVFRDTVKASNPLVTDNQAEAIIELFGKDSPEREAYYAAKERGDDAERYADSVLEPAARAAGHDAIIYLQDTDLYGRPTRSIHILGKERKHATPVRSDAGQVPVAGPAVESGKDQSGQDIQRPPQAGAGAGHEPPGPTGNLPVPQPPEVLAPKYPNLPTKLSRGAVDKLTARVDEMNAEEKRATAEWLDAQIKMQEEQGRKIADECGGLA